MNAISGRHDKNVHFREDRWIVVLFSREKIRCGSCEKCGLVSREGSVNRPKSSGSKKMTFEQIITLTKAGE